MMKTIQMTIDEALLSQVDETVRHLNTTRSAFVREALQQALVQYQLRLLEERDAAGYGRIPAAAVVEDEWEEERAWGDGWNAEK